MNRKNWARFSCLQVTLLAMGLTPTPPGRAQSPQDDPTTRPADGAQADQRTTITRREEELWRHIQALSKPVPRSQPSAAWFTAAAQRRAALLERVQLYLLLYPGGAHRDEAIRLELATLFEAAMLRGGDLEAFRRRVARYVRDPPSEAALHEAAYWEIVCRRAAVATSRPTTVPILSPDADLLAAWRGYVERFPRSRHMPRLATLLFEDAARRGDRAAMQATIALLARHLPDHTVTAALMAEWNRLESVGRTFWLTFRTAEGRAIDTRTYLGQPVLIVVWAGFDEATRRCALRVEQFRASHSDLRVVGVSLDRDPEQTAAAAGALGIGWPQFNDGLGWGNEFARTWGVRRIPRVFVIDRAGRLLGSRAGEGWEELARAALRQKLEMPASRPALAPGTPRPERRNLKPP